MFVYVIETECCDPFYGNQFEGHIFSNKEKAQEYINTLDEYPPSSFIEIEVDKI